jgi:hypothetical protein
LEQPAQVVVLEVELAEVPPAVVRHPGAGQRQAEEVVVVQRQPLLPFLDRQPLLDRQLLPLLDRQPEQTTPWRMRRPASAHELRMARQVTKNSLMRTRNRTLDFVTNRTDRT